MFSTELRNTSLMLRLYIETSIETVQNPIQFIHFYTIKENINKKKHN